MSSAVVRADVNKHVRETHLNVLSLSGEIQHRSTTENRKMVAKGLAHSVEVKVHLTVAEGLGGGGGGGGGSFRDFLSIDWLI